MSTDIQSAAQTVLSIASAFPTLESVESVESIVQLASGRGYLTPDEDDALRETFAKYLRSRAALRDTLKDLRPLAVRAQRQKIPDQPEIFIISYAATILLMRAGQLLVKTFSENQIAADKLDEAEPRFGIRRKEFTRVYRDSTSASNALAFVEANLYWNKNRAKFIEKFASDAVMSPFIQLIARDEPWVKTSADFYTSNLFRYRLYSFLRRNKSGLKQVTFALFKISGGFISRVKLGRSNQRKRVAPKVRNKLAKLMQPGDILVTRHDHAASNLFLPGYWPHAALYIGTEDQRAQLGLEINGKGYSASEDDICFLEALKDGVRFRTLSSTLGVDACTIIRPKLDKSLIREALARAFTHEGKEYDFEFDFRRSDKLVCTEVPYRAYHQCGHIQFELTTRAGRVCLSAEDLLDKALDESFFDVVAIYGYRGNRFATGERAKELLTESYRTH